MSKDPSGSKRNPSGPVLQRVGTWPGRGSDNFRVGDRSRVAIGRVNEGVIRGVLRPWVPGAYEKGAGPYPAKGDFGGSQGLGVP